MRSTFLRDFLRLFYLFALPLDFFYSQFGLTQTYGLNVDFFLRFFSFFFFWEIFVFYTIICPNVPKICLKLAYRLKGFESFHYTFWEFLFYFLFLLPNEMIITFLFCDVRSSVSVCVCVLSEWGGENVSLTCDFSFSLCALRERRSPSLCLSNETKNRLSSCVLLILWMRCFLSLKKIFLRYSIFSANLCVSNANSFKSIRKTRN